MLETMERQGIRAEEREHPRRDQKTQRADAHRFDRFDFLGHLHRAEFGGERGADPRRQHDPGEERPEFAGKSDRDQAGNSRSVPKRCN